LTRVLFFLLLQLFNFLVASGAKVESTTIIKDKITGSFVFALSFLEVARASSKLTKALLPSPDQVSRRASVSLSSLTPPLLPISSNPTS